MSRSSVFRALPVSSAAAQLCLVAARDGLGMELDRPVSIAPLSVEELSWALPGVLLPTDLTGGVRSFRHRRGKLQRVSLTLELAELEHWIVDKARRAFAIDSARVWLQRDGISIGICGGFGALAFDLLWAPELDSVRLIIAEPRLGGGLKDPAIAHVFHLCDVVFGKALERTGRVLHFGNAAQRLAAKLLPDRGVRLPACQGVGWGQLDLRRDRLYVDAERGRRENALSERAVRALEFAKLVQSADDALFTGNHDVARAAYLSALDHAPRHPELCYSVASIDKNFGERSEAALGLLVESLPAVEFGLVGAELLAQVGDTGGARLAVEKQASGERYAPLAALLWARLSELCSSADERAECLDQALACSPASTTARWARFELRARVGDHNGAVADAEQLEAAVRTPKERNEVLLRAAASLARFAGVQIAGRLYERALRYVPKDAKANVGLAEALIGLGKPERAFALLERAASLSDERDADTRGAANLALAKLLASHYRDRPQAIARAQQVAGLGAASVEARALEALWREQLGDTAGADLAYGRMREALEVGSGQVEPVQAVPWLRAAAKFALSRGDLRSAQRNAGLALRLLPRDAQVEEEYRALMAQGQPAVASAADIVPVAVPQLDVAKLDVVTVEPPTRTVQRAEVSLASLTEPQLEQRLNQLRSALEISGASAVLLSELSAVLSALGRKQELFAVLQARFEDGTPEEQALVRPELRRAAESLAEELLSESPEEAAVYAALAASL